MFLPPTVLSYLVLCCQSSPSPFQAAGDITYSIVRPTAFFKSLAGQIQLVKEGKPYVMFGDGNLASCKPISEQDLAKFMADCVTGAAGLGSTVCVWGEGESCFFEGQRRYLVLDFTAVLGDVFMSCLETTKHVNTPSQCVD